MKREIADEAALYWAEMIMRIHTSSALAKAIGVREAELNFHAFPLNMYVLPGAEITDSDALRYAKSLSEELQAREEDVEIHCEYGPDSLLVEIGKRVGLRISYLHVLPKHTMIVSPTKGVAVKEGYGQSFKRLL